MIDIQKDVSIRAPEFCQMHYTVGAILIFFRPLRNMTIITTVSAH